MIDRKFKEVIWRIFTVIAKLLDVGVDKVAHFMCCFLVSFVFGSMFGYWAGVIGAIMLGLGKELGDKRSPVNYFSWGDILADTLGALTGGVFVICIFGGGAL